VVCAAGKAALNLQVSNGGHVWPKTRQSRPLALWIGVERQTFAVYDIIHDIWVVRIMIEDGHAAKQT